MFYEKILLPLIAWGSAEDAEIAHERFVRIARIIARYPALLDFIGERFSISENPRPVIVAGIPFPNRVGLAAGLDKQGYLSLLMQGLGFGFIEVGTVTPRAQTGNARPRIIRIPDLHAIWNRMGFNSFGALRVAKQLNWNQPRMRVPVGISIGKNADTPNERALEDYQEAHHRLVSRTGIAYVAVNVSSPNTKGLRDLQNAADLELLLRGIITYEEQLALQQKRPVVPFALKIAPDLGEEDIESVTEVAERCGIAMLIATNTTVQPPGSFKPADCMLSSPDPQTGERKPWGGYSGGILRERVRKIVRFIVQRTDIPVIGVGGIECGADAKQLIDLGASLVQLYTGFIYRGPALVTECRHATDGC